MDKLARAGVLLESAYMQPVCTPSRAALMTGYYPIHTGRQVLLKYPRYLYKRKYPFFGASSPLILSLRLGFPSKGPGSLWTVYKLYSIARVAWEIGISYTFDWQVSNLRNVNYLGFWILTCWRWHLGFCHNDYLPTNRGFRTFNGHLTGWGEHYLHTRMATGRNKETLLSMHVP